MVTGRDSNTIDGSSNNQRTIGREPTEFAPNNEDLDIAQDKAVNISIDV